jgi:AbrB family looped-hinge helix DNA binding protein
MNQVFHSKLGEGRRVAIPAEVCQKLGISQGDPITIEIREDGLHLIPYAQIIREVQAAFAPYKKPGVSAVDELISERRAEAARESGE